MADHPQHPSPAGDGDGSPHSPEQPPHAGSPADPPHAQLRSGEPPLDADATAASINDGNRDGEANGDGDGHPTTGPAVPLDEHGLATEEPDRLALAVDQEQPPRLPFVVVGVGASAGGLEAFTEFLQAMPPDSGVAVVLVVHLPPDRDSYMVGLLGHQTRMPVRQVEDGTPVEPNHVYVIRPGRTMTLRDGRLHLTEPLEKRGHTRPIDDFFRSLAEEQRERAVCVVMSGMGSDGTLGAETVKSVGGVCVAQDPDTAQAPSMPRHLVDSGMSDYVLRPRDIPDALVRFAEHPYARGRDDAATLLRREQQQFADALAILRTRTRQDFSGYKRPTLMRRVQRRMGLNQVTALSEYVRLLRSNAGEVQALADDLLIHVTGFFRDPEAWESLRERVVVPLVAQREPDTPLRCWVTACSSGEEAYTLAMILAEAADDVGKQFDVKIFATDMADRSLGHARAGTYPAGIEGEVSPERLKRFFVREDSVYRVKQELREMVVFAPQNVLQDPPFSRLDICTCRNLLIYIEPEVQRRVLHLLHFGLREGGALFLGSSETVGGDGESLFEPLDKKWRIFRRVGATRHGMTNFPLPRGMGGGVGVESPGRAAEPERSAFAPAPRFSLAQATERALLARYTPTAVAINREHHVAYFHGNTDRYLAQPPGEPTRELLPMCRETVRGAVRAALIAAAENNGVGQARDGTIATGDGPKRVWVSVAPLQSPGTLEYWLVSFEEREEPAAIVTGLPPSAGPDAQAFLRLEQDLQRTREQLQNTIEALQGSNEELRASNEEVTSMNEELQSTNEELETSKEELQSLNEELTTVNAQLQAKMEEHEHASNDLTSLLASTDIAVIFLDRRFRIRRFTPAVRELLDMISGDVGRPLDDLARKFDDPALTDDAAAVLEKLQPRGAQVKGQGGRWYQRRVTPYRTAADRIDGVVITFVDVTARHDVEQRIREVDARYRNLLTALDRGFAIEEAVVDETGAVTDFRYVEVNPAFARHAGVGGDVVGRTMREVFPDVDEGWLEKFAAVVRTGEPARFQAKAVAADRWFDVFASRVEGTSPGQIAVLLADITQRRRAENATRENEERLRGIVDGVQDFAIFMLDAENRVTSWNAGAEKILGWKAKEMIGRDGAVIFTPEDRAADVPAKELRTAAIDGRAPDVRWHLRKDGTRFFANGVLTALGGPHSGFVKIMRDETDRKRAEDELQRLKAEAEAKHSAATGANEAKDAFLAVASHELRTPLSAMLIWSQSLRRGLSDPAGFDREALVEAAEAIEHSAKAQKHLIEDLLDTARITAGKLRLEPKDTDLAAAVRAAVETARVTADVKGVLLQADLADDVGVVRADPERLEQIVWNLLANAVKFTPAGGRVDLTLRRAGREVEIRVTDTGIGVDAKFLPHLFERFAQADTGISRTKGGLGLGLAICKQLVELHGGTIDAKSDGPNKGAAFTVRLPLPVVKRPKKQ
jgi:two-component system CheB/CheR fusion protein